MARNGILPEDFAVVALSLEALERGTSYGKLVAATTLEEREELTEAWKARLYGQKRRGRSRKAQEIATSPDGSSQ